VKEVEDQFWFLFAERHARLVPNGEIGHLALLDCPIVTVAAGNVLLRFIRWRDNSQVHVAPARLPGEWHELASILNAIEPDKVRRHSIVFFQDAARLLKEHLDLLEQGLSEDRYPRLKEQLAEAHKYDQAVTRQMENEINRALYS
jgi:hypothetical protein